MSLLSRSLESISLRNPPKTLKSLFASRTHAGVDVNENKALGLTTVFACIRIISQNIASLPLPVYRRLKPEGKEKATDTAEYTLLHDMANPFQTARDWRFLTAVHQHTWGLGISEIVAKNDGGIELWPIPPWRVSTSMQGDDLNTFRYVVNAGTKTYNLLPRQVVAFPFFSTSVFNWLSPIRLHKETIGSALAVREFGAKTFSQGVNPAGVISGVDFGDEDSEESYKKKIRDQYEGMSNAHRIMLFEDGVKFERIGLPPEDAQYLETQKFTTTELARIYNMPLHMIQEHEGSTTWGSGLEELGLGFITFTLRPTLVQWEQELTRKVISGEKRKDLFAEFLLDGLLRGKIADRYNAYKTGFQNGWLNLDEIRAMENLNPIPEGKGKIHMVPLNMQNLDFATERVRTKKGE